MKIYWTLSSVPELAALPRVERGTIWRTCYPKGFRKARVWLALVVCGLCGGLGAGIGSYLGQSLIGALTGAAIGGGIGGFILGQVATRALLPEIRSAVAQRHEKSA